MVYFIRGTGPFFLSDITRSRLNMAKVDVEMPKMGESITEGTVIVWHKAPGDAVEMDETLLEIGTDKVDTEVPSPAAGTLAEQLVEEGDTVEVGTIIARLETEAEEAAAADEGDGGDTPGAEEEATAEEDVEPSEEEPVEAQGEAPSAEREAPAEQAQENDSPAASEQTGGGEETDVVMPKMGESITEGTIIAWYKEPGDHVDLDETLVEIGTDKVDTEVPSPAEGYLKERLVEEGDTVEVGTKIAVLTSEEEPAAAQPAAPSPEEDVAEEERAGTEAAQGQPSGDGAALEPAAAEAAPAGAGAGGDVQRRGEDGRFYSPLVRSIATEEGLSMQELEQIEGSGREGRVTKSDVMAYLDERPAAPAQKEAPAKKPQAQKEAPQPPPQPASGDEYDGRVEIIEMDRMRQITAEHMVRSKATSAHVTSFAEADVTNLVRLRENNKTAFFEREGVKLTFTPFFVQAAVKALKQHPVVNSSVEGNKIMVKKDYHVGIAVAIGKKGLMAPVIRNAERKNLVGFAHAAADLAERTRGKRLQPDELQGGTFTVTNIGSLGSIMGTPIINQPQVGIVATGAIKKRPVVIEDPDLGDIIAVRHIMYACFSYDHRIIDGAMGASFLRTFCDVLESHDPEGTI